MTFTEAEKRYRRLILSDEDVGQALEWAHYILEHQLWDEPSKSEARLLGRGLQTAMIVAYTRPFSGNREHDHTLERPRLELETRLDKSQFQWHRHLCKLRNQVHAHSDAEVHDLTVSTRNRITVPISRNPYVMMSKDEMDRTLDLLKCVQHLIILDIFEAQSTFEDGDQC